MAKLLVLVLSAVVVGVFAEPPSSYLPPQARNTPSSQYGAPAGGFGGGARGSTSFHSQRTGSQSFSYNSRHAPQTGASQFRNAGHGTFGNSRGGSGSRSSFGGRTFGAPSQQYGAPSQGFSAPSQSYSAPSQSYGAPSQGNGFSRQGEFGGAASAGSFNSFSNGFGGSSQQFASAGRGFDSSSQSYSAPSAQYSPPSSSFSAPSAQYGPPSSQYSTPSSQYGPPSSTYGAPFGKKMDDDLAEPANYEYNYQVLAADDSGAEFGHQESRENEAAKGQYHVLLPDGRMQIVEYEADEDGFRPNIRYEESGPYPAARNNGNNNGYNNGYNGLQGPY